MSNVPICPECGEEAIESCRCPRSDSICKNGHEWHYCFAHKENRTVKGPSDHAKELQECTCLN